jgi:hypothetical protein
MKARRESRGIALTVFLTLALDGGGCLLQHPSTHRIGGLMGQRAGLNRCGRLKMLLCMKIGQRAKWLSFLFVLSYACTSLA